MLAKGSIRPLHAVAMGAVSGAVLLVITVPAHSGDTLTTLLASYTIQTVFREYLLTAMTVGAAAGAFTGGALWVTLTGQRMPTFYLALYWGFLAIVLFAALVLLYATVAAPRIKHDHAGRLDARSFWSELGGLYFFALLPTSAAAGTCLGVLVGARRAREANHQHGTSSTIEEWSDSPLHAAVIGAAYGGVLLVLAAVGLGIADETFPPVEALLPAGAVGGVGGALIGLALWTTMARRPVHPVYVAVGCALLAPALSLPLFLLCADLFAPSGGSGPSGINAGMYWGGMGGIYLSIVLPASAVLGAVFGAIFGVVKRARR